MSSSAIRSSIENSPWSATISVRRWSPKPAATSVSSSFRIFMRRGLEARISLHSLMNLRTSFSSSSSLVISRAVSRASRILRISADCLSDSLKRLRKLASELGVLPVQVALVDRIQDLGDDDLVLPGRLLLLDHRAGADRDPAASLLVALFDPLAAVDDRSGREVRPLDELPQVLHAGVGVVHEVGDRLDRKSTRLNSSH